MADSAFSTKTCSACAEPKLLVMFHASRKARDGRKGICKSCHGLRYSKAGGYIPPHRKPERLESARVAASVRETERLARTYECATCRETKPRSKFGTYPKGHRSKSCLVCVDVKARDEKPCRTCKQTFHVGQLRYGHCKPCYRALPYNNKAAQQAYRAKIAEGQGREYRPGRRGIAPQLNAHEKTRLRWQSEQRRLEAKTKPWNAPGLTEAERERIKYRLNPEYNVQQRLRAAFRRKRQGIRLDKLLREAVKRNGSTPKAEAFIGYSAAELRAHLERQFTKGMTWESFCEGRIHIDHIVPLSSFDLSNVDELKAAWQLPNLRPLWGKDNLAKKSKRLFLI